LFVKKEDAIRHDLPKWKVWFNTLATGDKIMLTLMYYEKGAKVPPHQHIHEQAGLIIKGQVKAIVGDKEAVLKEGDSYVCAANEIHAFEAIEDTEIMDAFSPPREEYR
jgi:quercetin dioxygenase-like cupin family protein